jgi:hypothetical protein
MPARGTHPGHRRGDLIIMVDSWLSGGTVEIVLIPSLLLFSIAAAIV